jgi:hypothetical protein
MEEEEAICLIVDRKQSKRRGLETRLNLQSHNPSDLLPAARPHLL